MRCEGLQKIKPGAEGCWGREGPTGVKRGKHRLNIWKSGISKELECLQCHYPAERQERKRFSVQEFKSSFFQRKVLTLAHKTVFQASVLVKGEW